MFVLSMSRYTRVIYQGMTVDRMSTLHEQPVFVLNCCVPHALQHSVLPCKQITHAHVDSKLHSVQWRIQKLSFRGHNHGEHGVRACNRGLGADNNAIRLTVVLFRDFISLSLCLHCVSCMICVMQRF